MLQHVKHIKRKVIKSQKSLENACSREIPSLASKSKQYEWITLNTKSAGMALSTLLGFVPCYLFPLQFGAEGRKSATPSPAGEHQGLRVHEMIRTLQYHSIQCRPRGNFIDLVYFGDLASSYRLYNATVRNYFYSQLYMTAYDYFHAMS